MERAEFAGLLEDATERTLAGAELARWRPLSRNVRYRVILNASHDTAARPGVEITYPEDSRDRFRDCASAIDVVHLLHRDGRVPEWIDPWLVRGRRGSTLV